MKRSLFIPLLCLCLCVCLFPAADLYSQTPSDTAEGSSPEPLISQKYIGDSSPGGFWEVDETSPFPVYSVYQEDSRTYFVHTADLPKTEKKISFGGALNLKYYTGISYDYLKKNLPGKTISVDVLIPKDAVSSSRVIPNKLRISLKSENNGEWAEYHGKKEWTNVRKEGVYSFFLKIPEKPVRRKGVKTFYPHSSILFAIDYYLMEGAGRHSSMTYSFLNFKIDGLEIDEDAVKWQFTENGLADVETFLPTFVKNSTYISSMGKGIDLDYRLPDILSSEPHEYSGNLQDFFLELSVYIPEELRQQKGTLALTISDDAGTVRSSVKNFSSCNLEGRVFLTLPLDAFSVKDNVEEIIKTTGLRLRIKTMNPHTSEMMPFVLEPVKIKQGRLIAFNETWKARDVQGLGGYDETLKIKEANLLGEDNLSVTTLEDGLYQMDATIRLKGGIDWKNPFYRVELVKEFDAPVDLDNMHIEVLMSPLTDTTDVWQKPFRARVGLLDINDRVMFGPNVSLSEGLSNLATLEVSTMNPIPKGFVSPGFDISKVKALVMNLEASHAHLEPRDVEVSFINLTISPREYTRTSPLKVIDFSRFKPDPKLWELTRLVADSGGYLVGINYPFPVIDVPEHIMKVPQIYPCVGMKETDPMHFGFSSNLTKITSLEDFKVFAANNINVVRLLVLGHLEGIYTFDERGKDIIGFGEGMESTIQEAAGMSVENFTKFLNENDKKLFRTDEKGVLKGLESHVLDDFTALLDILEETEKNTGKRVLVALALNDFLLGDGVTKEGPHRMFSVGDHPEVVLNPIVKVKAQALLWKMMKILSKDPRFYKYVAFIEIMNEPANATLLSTRKHFIDLLNFVGEGIYLLKDALGPSMPVSAGFRSWTEDLKYWAPLSAGLDILTVHYWESLESYNIDTPGLWPLDMPVSKLWKKIGAKPEGRLAGMGEISPGGNFKRNLFRLEKAGYDFSLVWSYSGHDGHNAKPVMSAIADYQGANHKFARLRRYPREELKEAFRYILTARKEFDSAGGVSPNKADKEFFAYIAKRVRPDNADRIEDVAIRRIVAEILLVVMFKDIPLTADNIKFLETRTLSQIQS